METKFETEVLSRLAVIESKLDGYKEIKKLAYDNENRINKNESKIYKNEEDIKEIQDKLKWLSRTTVGALITGVIGIAFVFVKIGLGVN